VAGNRAETRSRSTRQESAKGIDAIAARRPERPRDPAGGHPVEDLADFATLFDDERPIAARALRDWPGA
jgi:hypothetical protein